MAPKRAPHGTNTRYSRGCKCDPCREAGRAYRQARAADPDRHAGHLAAQARYREANRKANRERATARRNQRRAEICEYVRQVKSSPCADCGQQYPYYVMDLDHRPGEEKVVNVGSMSRSHTLEQVQAEVAKCDVVCSNCHRERTHQRKRNDQ